MQKQDELTHFDIPYLESRSCTILIPLDFTISKTETSLVGFAHGCICTTTSGFKVAMDFNSQAGMCSAQTGHQDLTQVPLNRVGVKKKLSLTISYQLPAK